MKPFLFLYKKTDKLQTSKKFGSAVNYSNKVENNQFRQYFTGKMYKSIL